jgi:hypothetical protein
MTVQELINALQIQDLDSEVYCASRSDNVFNIYGIDLVTYREKEHPKCVFLDIAKISGEKVEHIK